MATLKIVISNIYAPTINETFIQPQIDMSDLDEVSYAIDECCGQYLDMYDSVLSALAPSISREKIADGCAYIVEELPEPC